MHSGSKQGRCDGAPACAANSPKSLDAGKVTRQNGTRAGQNRLRTAAAADEVEQDLLRGRRRGTGLVVCGFHDDLPEVLAREEEGAWRGASHGGRPCRL